MHHLSCRWLKVQNGTKDSCDSNKSLCSPQIEAEPTFKLSIIAFNQPQICQISQNLECSTFEGVLSSEASLVQPHSMSHVSLDGASWEKILHRLC